MATPSEGVNAALRFAERVGRDTTRGVEAVGFGASLLSQSAFWLVMGRSRRQAVRSAPIFAEAMEMGIRALPIIGLLSGTIGIMMALQAIYSLRQFGAESQVTFGVAISVTREFAPLITGILVAGRSGSSLAARLGTMIISNEVDALRVMGVNPVRYLVVPSLVAMIVMLPTLVIFADIAALLGAGIYITAELGITMGAYVQGVLNALSIDDVVHGLSKSVLFAILITLVGVVDGSSVTGGAEGVGRVTTRSVVHGITAIVLTDMLFVLAATR